MKRKPTSKIWYTALYLHRVHGRTTFTGRDIHDNQGNARAWYHGQIPWHVLVARHKLFDKHGYPDPNDEWQRVYHACCPFIYRAEGLPELDIELKELFKPYVTMPERYYSDNFTFSTIQHTFKHGYFLRDDSSTPYTYRLNPDYLED